MKIIKLLFPGIIILFALLMVFPVGPSGLYYDDAACLYAGKFFLSHPPSILTLKSPELLNNVSKFERILWIYYRPLERIIWTLCFFLLGPNTISIGFLQKLLFLLSIYMIYRLGSILSGRTSGVIAAILFIFIPLPYGLLVWHTWLATQLGLLFLLSGIYFTLKGFLNNRTLLVCSGIFFAVLSWLSRESNVYIYFGVISIYMLDYLFYQQKIKSKNLNLLLICIGLFLCVIFYGYLFIKTPIYQLAEKDMHKLSINSVLPNINFYGGEIFNNLNAIFIIFCVYLFIIFRTRLQFTGLVWALVSLTPLLFSRFIAKTYLFDFFVGFSLFCGDGLSLLSKELFNQKKSLNPGFYKSTCSFFNNNLLQLLVLIIAILSLLFSIFKNIKDISKTALICHSKMIVREERLNYLKTMRDSENVFVPNLKAKEFYDVMLEIFDRKDIKIKVIASWNDVRELIIGENLLKNASFEDYLVNWASVKNKSEKSSIANIVENCSFDGMRSLMIDASPLRGSNYNLIDAAQLVSVEPGQTYIFGGIIKLEDFKEGIRFEVAARSGFEKGCWQTDVMNGNKNWQVLFNSFTPSQDQRELFFYAIRSENLARGKAYIDNVFVYKIRKPLLGYD